MPSFKVSHLTNSPVEAPFHTSSPFQKALNLHFLVNTPSLFPILSLLKLHFDQSLLGFHPRNYSDMPKVGVHQIRCLIMPLCRCEIWSKKKEVIRSVILWQGGSDLKWSYCRNIVYQVLKATAALNRTVHGLKNISARSFRGLVTTVLFNTQNPKERKTTFNVFEKWNSLI